MTGMLRRSLLALPLILPVAARAQGAANPQDQADLNRIVAYLDGVRSLKARFIQVAPNGAVSQGTAWLQRPGRMRFEYDPPTPLLLVANHGLVVFHDSKLRQTSNLPIGSSPLGILLADHVRLGGDVAVTGISRQPGQLQVTMVRAASPGDGSLTLVFADPPLALRQWAVVDAQRQETRVTLFNVQLGGSFDPKLFDLPTPNKEAPGSG